MPKMEPPPQARERAWLGFSRRADERAGGVRSRVPFDPLPGRRGCSFPQGTVCTKVSCLYLHNYSKLPSLMKLNFILQV
ncbi:hypothetical protein AV530_012854 [Patagioenas fasciata monilis]|uniref:Uncharacterized protein n=1 Tax=Patagioenas fasciata monilis TaxID=372326 RepID=A0A1V4J993_PATFA|nr:hypothetical protein AV530_012854 [Patagioenas fasciata monilis]